MAVAFEAIAVGKTVLKKARNPPFVFTMKLLPLAIETALVDADVRCDIATGKREIDHQPKSSGEKRSLQGLDGFFATRGAEPGSPLFVIAGDERTTRIACLRSDDNGATWHDHAISEPFKQPYAIGGCREVTPDGWIIGSFSDMTGEKKNGAPEGRVHFFRIRAKPQE